MPWSFARTFASFGISLIFPLFIQGQAVPFSVGTATAAPGQKSTGYLNVPAGGDAAIHIPVIVINGEKSGPVLESADMRPTDTVRSAAEQSCEALDKDLANWQQLNQQELAGFNALLATSKQTPLPVLTGIVGTGCKP